MISSKVMGAFAEGGLRKHGLDSTAQASEAHDERMARRSCTVSKASITTSAGRS
jgi:hypothetical protein